MYPPQSPKSSSEILASNVILICQVSLDDVVVDAKFQSVVFVEDGYQIHAVMIYL